MIPKEKIETEMRKINPCVGAEYTAYNHGFKQGVRFAEAELKPKIGADTIQNLFNYFQQEHGIMLMPSDLHEIENYMQPELATVAQEFAEWIRENAYNYMEANDNFQIVIPEDLWHFDMNTNQLTTSELFAKFDAERNQHQSELTCPICQSNRILDWPDKYQCRKCEHVWERAAK